MPDNESPFHRGEKELQSRLGIRDKMEQVGRRMIHDHIPEQIQEFFSQLPLLLVGTADEAGRPWASVLVGQSGFLRAIDPHTLRVKARPIYGDPLNRALVDGTDIGALGLEFHTRRRNRVNGKIAHVENDGFEIRVTQSFGNCPKYIQARELGSGSRASQASSGVQSCTGNRGESKMCHFTLEASALKVRT